MEDEESEKKDIVAASMPGFDNMPSRNYVQPSFTEVNNKNDLYYLQETRFVTNQRLLKPKDCDFYRVYKSDFTAPTITRLNIFKSMPRVTIRTFVPIQNKRKICIDGVEPPFQNMREPFEHHDTTNAKGLERFKKKFYGPEAQSSQLNQQKGLQTVNVMAKTAKSNAGQKSNSWRVKEPIPLPMFVDMSQPGPKDHFTQCKPDRRMAKADPNAPVLTHKSIEVNLETNDSQF